MFSTARRHDAGLKPCRHNSLPGLVLFALAAVMSGCQSGAPAKPSAIRIAVVPKGSTHEHWLRVRAGAEKAAAELSAAGTAVEVIWKAPLREDDREQQVQVVEGFISQGVSGLVLAPLDSRALERPGGRGRACRHPHRHLRLGAGQSRQGRQLRLDRQPARRPAWPARRMGELLGGKGRVLMLRYQEGSAATEEREQGFLDELKSGFPGIEVISSDQYAGATRDTAKRTSENLLNRFASTVDGIFTPNESSTAGMLLALQDIGKAGTITFVGFDYSAAFVEPLRRGELKGFVVQNPVNMGYLSVKTMVDHLQGRPVPKTVDTGVVMVTAENLADPAIQALLSGK